MVKEIYVKRNRVEISVKGLMLAVTVIVALLLSGTAVYLVNDARETVNNGSTQYSELLGDYSELNAVLYSDSVVTGKQVIDVINDVCRENNGICVTVSTKMNTVSKNATGTAVTDAVTYSKDTGISGIEINLKSEKCTVTPSKTEYALTSVSDRVNKDYINPLATFSGEIHKNENGMIDNILFVQN